ncbi:MAG: nickel transporter permease [Bacillota bacterium]
MAVEPAAVAPPKKTHVDSGVWARYRKSRSAMAGACLIALLAIFAVIGPAVAPYDPVKGNLPDQLQAPSGQFLLGTDEFGRDILSRIIYGSRIAIEVGFVAVAVAASLGVTLGLLSGYFGGWVDSAIMRTMDIMLAFPYLLLAMIVVAILGPNLLNAMIAVGVVYVPQYARLVRGTVLTVKESEFVMAARATGAPDYIIAVKHILLNCMAPIIVQTSLSVGWAIVNAAGLSFLGLGAQPPTPEWGAMLASGREYIFQAWWITTFPGLAILFTALGFNLLGDGLRDALDPRLKR